MHPKNQLLPPRLDCFLVLPWQATISPSSKFYCPRLRQFSTSLPPIQATYTFQSRPKSPSKRSWHTHCPVLRQSRQSLGKLTPTSAQTHYPATISALFAAFPHLMPDRSCLALWRQTSLRCSTRSSPLSLRFLVSQIWHESSVLLPRRSYRSALKLCPGETDFN